jgi:ABC-type transport system substrate-binding protein
MIWRFGKGMMHHAFTFRRVILIVCIVVALMVPASAQDGHGSGVIREGTTEDLLALRQFNPLLCDNFTCVRITNLMSPRLLNVDPQSVQFTGADAGSNTLVADWSISADGLSYTMTIRDDLIWSDGTPVTAYDALFSLSLVLQDELFLFYYDGDVLDDVIVGFSAPDENTLVMQLEQPTCEVLDLIDLPMIPAHVFDADFAGLVGDTVTAEDVASQVEQWMAVNEDYDYERVRTHPFSLNPLTTNESFFTFDEVRATEHLRLVSLDGQLAYEFVPIAGGNDGITRFLRRELNYEHNFPYTRTKDLLAAGATVEGGPTTAIYAIALNLADPVNPRDWDTEYEDGQGIHPVWGDIRVRRAAQLALNVPDLINRTVDGNGTPINGFAPPDAVFYNKDMPYRATTSMRRGVC